MSTPKDLAGWLAYIERQHPQTVALGLERVARVRAAMDLAPTVPVITVAGTNGKGSTCAMLESILQAAGYRVGLYSSPHLLRYNERVRIGGREADDAALVAAFARVELARTETAEDAVALTYFEFGTLAAVDLFLRREVDVMVLEVGLGGRLDAVNAFDADCAVVTSIGMDHMDYLGATREAIGREKGGNLSRRKTGSDRRCGCACLGAGTRALDRRALAAQRAGIRLRRGAGLVDILGTRGRGGRTAVSGAVW